MRARAAQEKSAFFCDVFEQVRHGAAKVRTQLVDDVGASAVATMIQDFGKRHSVNTRTFSYVQDRDASRIPELLFFNLLA